MPSDERQAHAAAAGAAQWPCARRWRKGWSTATLRPDTRPPTWDPTPPPPLVWWREIGAAVATVGSGLRCRWLRRRSGLGCRGRRLGALLHGAQHLGSDVQRVAAIEHALANDQIVSAGASEDLHFLQQRALQLTQFLVAPLV